MENLELLKNRHSVRSYTTETIPTAILNKLRAEVTMTNTHEQGLKFQIITDDPEPFKAFSRSYGSFINPRNYLAAVVDTAAPNVEERAGYFAERFAIKAVELGLGTCFVGGTYNSSVVKAQLRAGEKVLFIVIFGYELEKKRVLARVTERIFHHKQMAIEDFFEPREDLSNALEKYPLLREGLEAVACAPSALNKRPARVSETPVRFGDQPNGDHIDICLRPDGSVPTELCMSVADKKQLVDLGIAKFNFCFATGCSCEWGNGGRIES